MKIISWNVLGLGNPQTRLAMRKILQQDRPQLIFVRETKLEAVKIHEECKKLGFDECFTVSRNGKSEGIVIMWKSDINVHILSYSRHYIDVKVQSGNGKKWRCTGVYGHPEAQQKQHTWTLLRRLSGLSSKPWLCFGDFNEILRLDEKSGGNDKNIRMVSEFKEAVQDSKLADLGYKGYQFTWCNGMDGQHFVEERLDRFLCNEEWGNHFQEQPCQNLVSVGSDHYPIMMEIKKKGPGLQYVKKTFPRVHYEDMWSSYDTCKSIIKAEWENYGVVKGGSPVMQFKVVAKSSLAHLK
ncbi:uncharacterized protein LOC127903104 [Citrus sinensis]|uniref:uncharacterized protein LOC127903104 n=1 Tax=Citrus sinensis TaxID=2711 RepID=UPI0022786D8B|nr:uncharacterized protein LOC127903104 [Citrus sinensis]